MASASIAALTAPTSTDGMPGEIQQQQQQQQQQKQWHHLPRSVVWRLRLGLLQPPPPLPATNNNSSNKPTLETILQTNATLLQEEEAQYQQRQETYRHHFVQDPDHNTRGQDPVQDPAAKVATTTPDPFVLVSSPDPLSSSTAAEDPLTAMLQQQEAQEHRRHDLELKYRKEKALQKRGLTVGGGAYQPTEDSRTTTTTLSTVDRETVRLSLGVYLLLLLLLLFE